MDLGVWMRNSDWCLLLSAFHGFSLDNTGKTGGQGIGGQSEIFTWKSFATGFQSSVDDILSDPILTEEIFPTCLSLSSAFRQQEQQPTARVKTRQADFFLRQAGQADTIQFADALKDYGKAGLDFCKKKVSELAEHGVRHSTGQVLKCGVLAENNAAAGNLALVEPGPSLPLDGFASAPAR